MFNQLKKNKKSFTLLEVLIAITVIAIVATILSPVASKVATKAKVILCVSKLKNIAYASKMYYNDYGILPSDQISTLMGQLQPYIKNPDIFICPSAPKPYTGDLQLFYVERSDNDKSDVFSIGCPYHRRHGVSVVLNHDGSAVLNRSAGVYRNTPSEVINPGDKITNGILYFADGSTAEIGNSAKVKVIESFWRSDNRLYSLIRIDAPQGQNEGGVKVSVTPGSKFEVVTPAAIAGVEGTEFETKVKEDELEYTSEVIVNSGIVTVTTRDSNKETVRLYPGQSKRVKRNK